MQCAYNTQYCEVSSASMAATYNCRAVPAGCTGNPCDTCLSSANIPRRSSCSSIAFGSQRAVILGITP